MKLDEIEAYAYEVVYPDYDGELFHTLCLAKERAREVEGDIRNLYTAEQMQEYAKECVRAALKEYVGPYSEKKASSIISRVVK